MATNFPTTLDTSATLPAEAANVVLATNHVTAHQNIQDALEAVEAKIGVNSSAVTTTHDYKLSGVTGSDKAVSKTGTEILTNKELSAGTKVLLGSDATGDMYYNGGSGVLTRLPKGADGTFITYSGGVPATASLSNASTTVAGLVEIPTQAETDAGTATGGTGAKLAITPDLLRAKLINSGVTDTGSSTAYAIAPSPAITAYAIHQEFSWKAANTNTTTTPTLNVNALGAVNIVNPDGTAIAIGQIPAGAMVTTKYDGTSMQLGSNGSAVGLLDVVPNTSTIPQNFYTYTVPMLTDVGSTVNNFCGFTSANIADGRPGGGFGYSAITSSNTGAYAYTTVPGSGSTVGSYTYVVSDGKAISFKTHLAFGSTTNIKAFGFLDNTVITTDLYTAQTDVSQGIRIIENAGTLYAQNASGTTATSTSIGAGITATDWNTYEIVFTPGVNIKYYINGVLKATHTTNLPATATFDFGYGISANADTIYVKPMTISIQV